VQTIFTTAGDPDALAWIHVRDVDDLKRVIDGLRRSGRVTGMKTLMVLGTSTRIAQP
jgi:Lrp/AsnC family leucine-responsive transcriptional regulator